MLIFPIENHVCYLICSLAMSNGVFASALHRKTEFNYGLGLNK